MQQRTPEDEPLYDSSLFLDPSLEKKVEEFRERKLSTEKERKASAQSLEEIERSQKLWKWSFE